MTRLGLFCFGGVGFEGWRGNVIRSSHSLPRVNFPFFIAYIEQ